MSTFFKAVRRVSGVALGAATLALGLPIASASAEPSSFTCQGGSVPSGTYSSVSIAGRCSIDAGTVNIVGNLTVRSNAALNAAFGGSDLHVGRNLLASSGAIVVLGCEPVAFACFNDPDQQVGTLSTHDSVGANFVATGALMVLSHNNRIGGNVIQVDGGGGVTCSLFPLGPDGPPAYSTWEDNTIARNATITGVRTCWMGFIRNTVGRNVVYSGNVLADPDGNEVVTNTIGRDLICSGNNPTPQRGDSDGDTNIVHRHPLGQCANIT